MEKKLLRSFGISKKDSDAISCLDVYIKFKKNISKIEIHKNGKVLKSKAYTNDLYIFARNIIYNLENINQEYITQSYRDFSKDKNK